MATKEFQSSTGSAPVQQYRYSPSTDLLHRGRNAQNEMQYNADMANWQWQNQIDLMNYQNRYNSPAEQMARYEEAGLNPNFAQADSGNMTGTVTPPSGASVDSQNIKTPADDLMQLVQIAGSLASVAGGIQGFAKTAADITNTQATTEATRTNTRIGLLRYNMDKTTRELEDSYKAQEIRNLVLQNTFAPERFRSELQKSAADTAKTYSDIRRSDALLPFETENWKLRNVFQGYENKLRKGDVDFDSKNYHGYYRRMAQLANLVSAQNVPSFLGFLSNDLVQDQIQSQNVNKAITGISDSFNKAGSAYNRVVNGIVEKVYKDFDDIIKGKQDKDSFNRDRKSYKQRMNSVSAPAGIYAH